MRPELFEVFGVSIPSYGAMLALSFLAGIGLATLQASREGLNPHGVLDAGIWIIVGALIGARLYYVLLHPEDFRGNLLSIVDPLHGEGREIGGLVTFGGMMGGILAAFVYLRARRYSFPLYMDAFAPSIALGVFLTRIGCFLNGCCYGTELRSPLGVSFPPETPAGGFQARIQAADLHPSQLYESFGGLILLAIVLSTYRGRRPWQGNRFYLVMVLYALLRFLVDFTRHYEAGERLGEISHSQIVSIVFFMGFGLMMFRGFTASETVPEGTEPAPVGEGPDHRGR